MTAIPSSIVPALAANARRLGDAPAVRFLLADDPAGDAEEVSFAALDQRARAAALRLRAEGLRGERALLLYPPGIEFVVAFVACLYEGVVAVPVWPPDLSRLERTLPRLRAVAADAGARAVLTTGALAEVAPGLLADAPELQAMRWLPTDAADVGPAAYEPRDAAPDGVAFLQYTSGSTASPRGVRVTHANLVHNSEAIRRLGAHAGDSVSVVWLPSYHDMGLIGGVLQPLYVGFRSVLMSPLTFLRRPAAWLEALTAYRGTTSAFPNFALDLCARKVTDDELRRLDLSAWRTAWNGAEPVRPATLARFEQRFAAAGFDARAMHPVYGLAESTLIVTGPRAAPRAAELAVSRRGVARHRVEAPEGPDDEVRYVSCGRPIDGLEVRIAPLPDDAPPGADDARIGEVLVRGPSVAAGYWNRPDDASFDARLDDGPPFLRTGDLGFLRGGELVITGRAKDVIILHGQNHYPQDIEQAVEQAHPNVRAGSSAAVSLEADGTDALAVVAEVQRGLSDDALALVARAVREAVVTRAGIAPRAVALLAPGALPKTSSGKVQRHACREGLAAGTLPALHLLREAPPAPPPPAPEAADGVRAKTLAVLVRATGHDAAVFRDDTRLVAWLGLDSVQLASVVTELERAFGPLGDDLFASVHVTFGELVRAIAERTARRAPAAAPPAPPVAAETRVEDFPEVAETRAALLLFEALDLANPYARTVDGRARDTVVIAGRELLNFATYNYLGLAGDPRVDEAAVRAVRRYGTSASASRVASGDRPVHLDLEAALAGFLGCEGALVFASGYATNVAAVAALVGPGDVVLYDALAHESILAGARLSGARRVSFPHNDVGALDRRLAELRGAARRALVVVEGAYSMDGDLCPLPALVAVKKRHGAMLYVDEAHSLGCVGATGRGVGERFDVPRGDVDVWMGTLSKALASCGGFVAGRRALVEHLRYRAGGFVYAAANSPANAAAALAALELLAREPRRVEGLQRRAAAFARLCRERGVDTGRADGAAIVPAIVGASVRCLRVADALERRGVHAPPVLHPAVEEGAARLRFFVSALHSDAQLTRAADALAEALAEHPARAPVALAPPRHPPTAPHAPDAPRRHRRVFVTGGTGFIGARVVRALVARGAEVRCLVRPGSRRGRLDGLPVTYEPGDLFDRDALARGARGADAVVHLACASSWADVRALGPRVHDVAVAGTRNVLDAAARAGVARVVHVSSVAALNASERPEVFDESARYEIADRRLAYSLAKRGAEAAAMEAAAAGLDVVVVSPAEVFGPDDDAMVTAGSVADILRASTPVACDGGTSVAHVDDVAEGVVLALERGRRGERYILGGDNVSVRALTELVLRLAGRPARVVDVPNAAAVRLCRAMERAGLAPPIAPDVLEYATLYWFVDSSKARRELGYRPRGAEATLAPVVRWLTDAGRAAAAPARAAPPLAPPVPAAAPARRVDHTVVSVSLGAPSRDHAVEVELLGRRFAIERRGTGGDFGAWLGAFRALDGRVDALGVGGAEFFMSVGGRRYEWAQVRAVRAAVTRSKLGDGNGIKHLLADLAVRALAERVPLRGRRALVTAAVDRYGLARALPRRGLRARPRRPADDRRPAHPPPPGGRRGPRPGHHARPRAPPLLLGVPRRRRPCAAPRALPRRVRARRRPRGRLPPARGQPPARPHRQGHHHQHHHRARRGGARPPQPPRPGHHHAPHGRPLLRHQRHGGRLPLPHRQARRRGGRRRLPRPHRADPPQAAGPRPQPARAR